MISRLARFGLIAIAGVAGLVCSELLCKTASFRDKIGCLGGRGHLVALVNGTGIYEIDLQTEDEATLSDLIVAANLRRVAAKEAVDRARIDHDLTLLEAEFTSEKAFIEALHRSHLSVSWLREEIAAQIRAVRWLEKQAAPAVIVSEPECRQFYEAHRDLFVQPARFRASHIFLAAHAATPAEVIDEKQLAIAALSARLDQGEAFSQLAAEASEDEASKLRGGDLAFFSKIRMTPEFFAKIEKLRAGQTSKPFRTHLGFHIAQLREIKPAHALSFEEAQTEISREIANERRRLSVARLRENLAGSDYSRPN